METIKTLADRINNRKGRSLIDVNTKLQHLAIITYRVPIGKISKYIPKPFKLFTYFENGIEYALVSAVPFKDKDFAFYRIWKLPKYEFFQTNFRTYIIDERTGNYCAWFFGTTLGSRVSIIPKILWNMPWEFGKYTFQYKYYNNCYSEYIMSFKSMQGNGIIDITTTDQKMQLLEGFDTFAQQLLILTHPTIGYYNLKESKLGTYEIWHPQMNLYVGKANNLYFELFEKLGLLSKEAMQNPHSILVTSEIEFDILLPPRKISI